MQPISKNIGPFLAFDKKWFENHQSILLWFLNSSLTKRLARWILKIRPHDIGYDGIIVQILPHAYTVFRGFVGDKVRLTADFRTHPKYAKRIYYAFRPLWWALHFWDWLVADRFIPQWSFGFDTLTVYPDPSSGAATVDGYVMRGGVNEIFSTIRSGAGTLANVSDTIAGPDINPSSTTDQYNDFKRGICNFDTSPLGTSATIESVVLSLFGAQKFNGVGSTPIHVAGATPASNNNLVAADYGQCQTTSFASIAYSSFLTSAYNNVSLNGSGVSNISKTGISKFSTQLEWDINNNFTGTWADGFNTQLFYNTADQGGNANDPKLVVTYIGPISLAIGIVSASIKKQYQVKAY